MANTARQKKRGKVRRGKVREGPPVVLRRVAKGTRPKFHDHESVDQLFAIVTALTAETSVAFDRIDTLERLLAAGGPITAERIEAYRPTAEASEARLAKREQLIERVFAVFEAYGRGTISRRQK